MVQIKVVEKIETHFVFNNFFVFEKRAVYEIRLKNTVEQGQPTDDNMVHAHCMLDT
jgi:hypothetical protein